MPTPLPLTNPVQQALLSGLVIPAHPLALTAARKLDETRQRALTRYYHAAGVGGVAVGVHTTQFEIRRPSVGLFKPVLELAARTIAECDAATGRRTIQIAGICGQTAQALEEARAAQALGYDAGLLSLTAFGDQPEAVLLRHCQTVAREIPIFGFYLQPAVGGRVFSLNFWRGFAEIPEVIAIKIAAFNRYYTLDVVRAVAEVGRAGQIALYTGNDDNIVIDLLTEFALPVAGGEVRQRLVGGLLGHWACWTQSACQVFEKCQVARAQAAISRDLLTLATQVTDCNAAFFDPAHGFAGCIAGIHEVLRRQGLLANRVCLNPAEDLSPGQLQEIDRVYAAYPELNDDAFVRQHLDEWLR